MNFFFEVSEAITSFVEAPGHEALLAATGPECVPFRGRVRGTDCMLEAQARLRHGVVDVLIVGSNPNVPKGLAGLESAGDFESRIDAFKKQARAGRTGHFLDDSGRELRRKWDPISSPSGAWRVYIDAVLDVVHPDSAGFINYFLWGSSTFSQLANCEHHSLQDAFGFCERIFIKVLHEFRPKILIVPFSLARSLASPKSGASFVGKIYASSETQVVLTDRGKEFTVRHAMKEVDGRLMHLLFVPHPSSIRLASNKRLELRHFMAESLRSWLNQQSRQTDMLSIEKRETLMKIATKSIIDSICRTLMKEHGLLVMFSKHGQPVDRSITLAAAGVPGEDGYLNLPFSTDMTVEEVESAWEALLGFEVTFVEPARSDRDGVH